MEPWKRNEVMGVLTMLWGVAIAFAWFTWETGVWVLILPALLAVGLLMAAVIATCYAIQDWWGREWRRGKPKKRAE